MLKHKWILRSTLLFAWAVPSQAEDFAGVLAHILAGKGVINASDVATVEAAAPDRRVQLLASILEQKGLLNAADLAKLRPFSQGAEQAVAVQLTPPVSERAAAPLVAGSVKPVSPSVAPAVTSQNRFPLTVYGTILTNAFVDTSLTNIQDIPLFTGKNVSDALGNDKSFDPDTGDDQSDSRLSLCSGPHGAVCGVGIQTQARGSVGRSA